MDFLFVTCHGISLKVDGVIFKFISKRKFLSCNLVLVENVSSWCDFPVSQAHTSLLGH
jgi:hypothetical protein